MQQIFFCTTLSSVIIVSAIGNLDLTFLSGDMSQVCRKQGSDGFFCPTSDKECDPAKCPIEGPSLAPAMSDERAGLILISFDMKMQLIGLSYLTDFHC